jgi:phosphatidate cytidylyltransferase
VIPLDHRDMDADGHVASAGAPTGNLALRIASSVVLAPLVLAAAYAGGWLFFALCAVAAAGILWEWTHLVSRRTDIRLLLPGLAALAIALLFAGLGWPGFAMGAIAVGAVITGGAMASGSRSNHHANLAVWAVGGVVYAGIAFLGPALLRRDAEFGFVAFLFLAATVWMTDISAYFVGRTVGGPLLWPSVSPGKTWAGAVGGLVGGLVGGIAVAYASGLGKVMVLGVVAALLSVVAQGGDLFESAVKRHFGAKDTSRLIPGHGGLMDRLDGFVAAALAALLLGALRYGTDAPGQGLLIW